MIVHVIMMKFKPEHQADIPTVRERLLTLPSHIDVIRHYEVGLDVMRSERAWDMVIYSKFDSLETLAQYDQHPMHQEVVAYLRPMRSDIASVDYEA
jgi:hypothetical protein